MPDQSAQLFLNELDHKLWPAVYKHSVLGLIFLKYVSASFVIRQKEIEAQLLGPKCNLYLDPAEKP